MKLSYALLIVFGLAASTAFAQDDSKIMVGVSYRSFGAACTNCAAVSGPAFSGGYAVTDKIVATLDLGIYSKSSSGTTSNVTAFGVSGDYYLKGAYKGFYIGPDVTFINITEKFSTTEYTQSNLTVGVNLGWGIVVAERWRIIPHFGYGTWFENSNGRITLGVKVGFKI